MLIHADTMPIPVPVGGQSRRWYAIQTRSRFEKIVSADLALKGIDHYLATAQAINHWKDRKKLVELPLFPGYVFVRFQDEEVERLRVLRTVGVVRILGSNGGVEPIPDREIDSLRQLLLSGKPSFGHPFLREGSWVRVRKGALAGVEGRLTRVKKQCRLVLSVDLLSQSVATEVDAWEVEPAPEPRLQARS